MAIPSPSILDLTPYVPASGDTGAFIAKTAGAYAALSGFSGQLNAMILGIESYVDNALQSVSPLAHASQPIDVSQPVVMPSLRVVMSEGDIAHVKPRAGALSFEAGSSNKIRFCGVGEADIVELSVRINGQYEDLLHTANIEAKYKELQQEVVRTGDFTASVGDKNLMDMTQGPVTAEFPPDPAPKDKVAFVLYRGSYTQHALHLLGNGQVFKGGHSALDVKSNRARIEFRFNGDEWGVMA